MEQDTKGGWVYIMADRYRGTLYVGVTAQAKAQTFAPDTASTTSSGQSAAMPSRTASRTKSA